MKVFRKMLASMASVVSLAAVSAFAQPGGARTAPSLADLGLGKRNYRHYPAAKGYHKATARFTGSPPAAILGVPSRPVRRRAAREDYGTTATNTRKLARKVAKRALLVRQSDRERHGWYAAQKVPSVASCLGENRGRIVRQKAVTA